MSTDTVADNLLIRGVGEPFCRLVNAEGKVWLMPVRNMRVAMSLYQPSGRKGKLLKRFFPLLHRLPFVRRAAGARIECCRLSDDLNHLLVGLFNEPEPEFAVFFGTPCVHRKITVQISRGNRILGYFKLSDNRNVSALFRHEADVLDELRRKGVTDIPECLYCGRLNDRADIFVQSTAKSIKSRVLHEWTPLHDEFVDSLYRKTRTVLRFDDSDYCRTLAALQKHRDWLPADIDTAPVVAAVEEVMSEWRGRDVEFSAYHGDFTPWNMFSEGGRLFVFDWEYSQLTCPPMMDRYHFFTQTAIFGQRLTADDIVKILRSPAAGWVDRKTYLLYLLEVIARFTLRERGVYAGDMARSMSVWCELVKYLRR